MLYRIKILAACLACLLFASTGLALDATVVRRAAFDIGSAVIKCTVADVDISTGRVVELVETLSEKVDFSEDLDRSYDSNLSTEIMDKGVEALMKMKRVAEELKAVEYSAAGGSVFHQAQNGRAYFVRIEEKTGIPSRIISEQQAAMLSFHAVQQHMEDASRELLVWDIGGGSMNMTARRTDGGLLFYLDSMASVSFKNALVELIQKKNPDTTATPNPVSAREAEQALAYIKAHATVAVPTVFKSKIRNGNVLVAGIGGVHYYSVPEVMGGRPHSFTRERGGENPGPMDGKAGPSL